MIVYATRYLGEPLMRLRKDILALGSNGKDRHLLDLYLWLALQYDLQNPLPRGASVYYLSDAERLQADPRSEHRYPTSAVLAWW